MTSFARTIGKALLGPRRLPLIDRLARGDARYSTFVSALEYVNFEQVPGDVVECGVFGGVSLALLARAITLDPKGMTRRIIGIDSFEGLPVSEEQHARWQPGDCATMHAPHPILRPGDRVTPETTRQLFAQCGLTPPVLHEGRFDAVLPAIVPSMIAATAVVHIDCDLYESTRDCLIGIAPALQDGTLLLFDDWFHYRGSERKGEARAFREFLDLNPHWQAVHWRQYGTFCNAFILSRR